VRVVLALRQIYERLLIDQQDLDIMSVVRPVIELFQGKFEAN